MAAIHPPLTKEQKKAGTRAPLGANVWVLAGMAILGISAMLPVLQNSAATSQGFRTQAIEADKAKLNGEIRTLEADVASLTSLARIQRRAQEIGLEPGARPIYVSVSEPGPAPAKLPAQYLPGPDRSSEAPAAWWQSLNTWVPLPAR